MAVASEPQPPYRAYVPDDSRMEEFTWSAVLTGAVLGIVFGASSLYLVLKIGMTVSASIPVAVLAITLFRWMARLFHIRQPTILENNIIQTTGSAGESIAFGVGVTMPALMLIGFEMDLARVMVVAILGGLLGILMMIPLRRAFIVKLHASRPGEEGKLLYPEGTACAQVLKSAEVGGTSGATVFAGFGLAFVHKFLTEGMIALKSTLHISLGYAPAARLSNEYGSELLGVGYILGARIGALMLGGAVLGSLVIVPTIAYFGAGMNAPLPPGEKAIHSMSAQEVRDTYLVFIGAGCVAAAGIISMFRTMPMIIRSVKAGFQSAGHRGKADGAYQRTEDDMSPRVVLGGALLLLLLLVLFLAPEVGLLGAILGALLVLVLGYLFVTVSSRLTGEVGSTNNPISGMTVACLLLTCLIFLALGMTRPLDALLALSIAGVICIAISNGGTTSQDLKTGFLLGATPRWQQWAILIGALTSALVIGGTLLVFNQAGLVYSTRNLPQVDASPFFPEMREIAEYEGTTYKVWYPSMEALSRIAQDAPAEIKDGEPPAFPVGFGKKYLVNEQGRIVYYVDPTITGKLEYRDHFNRKDLPGVNLKKYLPRLKDTAVVDGKTYRIWDRREPEEDEEKEKQIRNKDVRVDLRNAYPEVPAGEYLVDEDGRIVFVNEPETVGMKFRAPKTQVMGIIINGLLNQNLNWTMILLGAFIAVTLELCGISSLPFAVGFYVPMEYSTPIFIGGMVRWGVDWWTAPPPQPALANEEEKAVAEVEAIARSETSPAVLLSSGFIAGGSLAGVLIAFLNLAPPLRKAINLETTMPETLAWVQSDPVAILVFLALIIVLGLTGLGVLFGKHRSEPPGSSTLIRDETR